MTAKDGQSIYDICLQLGYELEDIYKLMALNNVSNINQLSFANKVITFNSEDVNDFSFQKSNVVLSTADYVSPYDPVEAGDFLLRQDDGFLLRQDGGKFLRQ